MGSGVKVSECGWPGDRHPWCSRRASLVLILNDLNFIWIPIGFHSAVCSHLAAFGNQIQKSPRTIHGTLEAWSLSNKRDWPTIMMVTVYDGVGWVRQQHYNNVRALSEYGLSWNINDRAEASCGKFQMLPRVEFLVIACFRGLFHWRSMVYVLVSVILTLHPMRLDTQPSQLNCDCPSIPFTFRTLLLPGWRNHPWNRTNGFSVWPRKQPVESSFYRRSKYSHHPCFPGVWKRSVRLTYEGWAFSVWLDVAFVATHQPVALE